jgi:hypothetical protein
MLARQGDDAAKLRWALLEALSRPASDGEVAVLKRALDRERERYTNDQGAAIAYLSVGEALRNCDASPAEHAAWSQVAAVVLNLSETVTRN